TYAFRASLSPLFYSILPRPPRSTLFPYTTLFRSDDRPAREEHRRDVDVHHLPPLLERDLLERPHLERRVEAGVVDEDVDAAAAGNGLVDQPLDVGLVGHVDRQPDAVLERARRLVCPAQVRDHDARTRRGEPFCKR